MSKKNKTTKQTTSTPMDSETIQVFYGSNGKLFFSLDDVSRTFGLLGSLDPVMVNLKEKDIIDAKGINNEGDEVSYKLLTEKGFSKVVSTCENPKYRPLRKRILMSLISH